jgi:hypothetical protein
MRKNSKYVKCTVFFMVVFTFIVSFSCRKNNDKRNEKIAITPVPRIKDGNFSTNEAVREAEKNEYLNGINILLSNNTSENTIKASLLWKDMLADYPLEALDLLHSLDSSKLTEEIFRNHSDSLNLAIENNAALVGKWVVMLKDSTYSKNRIKDMIFTRLSYINSNVALDSLGGTINSMEVARVNALLLVAIHDLARQNPEKAWLAAQNRFSGAKLSNALQTVVVSASKENPTLAFQLAQRMESKDALEVYPSLFDNWFKADSTEALGIVSSLPTAVAMAIFKDGSIFEHLANHHSEQLIDALRTIPLQDSTKNQYNLAVKLLARKNPTLIPTWLETLPQSPMKQALAVEAFISMSKENPAQAMQLVETLPAEIQKSGYQGLVRVLTQTNYEQALKFANEHDAETNGELMREIARVSSVTNPVKATEILADASYASRFDEGFRSQFVDHTARNFASKELSRAKQWVEKLPPQDAPMGYRGLLYTWLKVDSLAASEWLSQQPAGPARDAGAQEIINQIKDTDPETAEQWRKSMGGN